MRSRDSSKQSWALNWACLLSLLCNAYTSHILVAKLDTHGRVSELDFIAQLIVLTDIHLQFPPHRLLRRQGSVGWRCPSRPTPHLLWVPIHGTRLGFHLLCEVLPPLPGPTEPASALTYPSTDWNGLELFLSWWLLLCVPPSPRLNAPQAGTVLQCPYPQNLGHGWAHAQAPPSGVYGAKVLFGRYKRQRPFLLMFYNILT